MGSSKIRFLGVGSPVVDLLAQVQEEYIASIQGEKGGMELVCPEEMEKIIAGVDAKITKACGGSAGNTTFAVAKLGAKAAFLGQLGRDEDGTFYTDTFASLGGEKSHFKFIDEVHTARCFSMVTPDSQRTMRTDLGAAALLNPASISVDDFKDVEFVHVEGYLLFNPELARQVLESAKKAGCQISLDLGSFEVVAAAGDILPELLETCVDYVFANEDEAKSFTGSDDPQAALQAFGKLCRVAVVKLGKDGLWLSENKQKPVFVGALPAADVVDTTGAGDYWAAGFIWGLLDGRTLVESAKIGALLGCEVVQQLGAELTDDVWDKISTSIRRSR